MKDPGCCEEGVVGGTMYVGNPFVGFCGREYVLQDQILFFHRVGVSDNSARGAKMTNIRYGCHLLDTGLRFNEVCKW